MNKNISDIIKEGFTWGQEEELLNVHKENGKIVRW